MADQKTVAIDLKDEQLQILQSIAQEKQALEAEYQKVIRRETEFIVNLCAAKDVKPQQGIKFEDKKMIVPIVEEVKEEKKLKKA